MKEIRAIKSLEMLDRSVAELKQAEVPSIEEIQLLFQNAGHVKKEIEQEIFTSGPYIRHLNWIYHKVFGSLHKIDKLQRNLGEFLEEAKKGKKAVDINTRLWELKRKGLFTPLAKEEAEQALIACSHEMQAIHCPHAFTFRVKSLEEGSFELLIYTLKTKECQSYEIAYDAQELQSVEALLAKLAPYAMPLSQLQEVAGWLKVHASSQFRVSQILSTAMIEQKLAELLKVYPQGAYILHPAQEAKRNSLILSRIQQKGAIQHMTVDLEKALGHYTICDEQGREASKTLVQFRRTLEQMGNPLRLRSADD